MTGTTPTVHVCIAHYNEDTSWTQNLIYPHTIISRAGIPAEKAPNKGNEASSFIEYIINNYDQLADYTYFVHGHRTSWHNAANVDEVINATVFKHAYYNINDFPNGPLRNHPDVLRVCNPAFGFISKIIGYTIRGEDIVYRSCAQFYVKRELIQAYPKETWQKLYKFIMSVPLPSYWSGRIFEYTWHCIFLRDHVDVEKEICIIDTKN